MFNNTTNWLPYSYYFVGGYNGDPTNQETGQRAAPQSFLLCLHQLLLTIFQDLRTFSSQWQKSYFAQESSLAANN